MVSNALCLTLHILGYQYMYSRAKSITDHYSPWPAFFPLDNRKERFLKMASKCLSAIFIGFENAEGTSDTKKRKTKEKFQR